MVGGLNRETREWAIGLSGFQLILSDWQLQVQQSFPQLSIKKFVEKSLYLLDLRNLLNATKQGVLLMLSRATFEGFLVHQMTYQKQIIVQ